MDEVEIRCPYCNSSDVECIDSLDCEINFDGGGEHLRYTCNNESCYEIFYVLMIVDVAEVSIGKEKWGKYEIIYSK
ncbi:hypothetical protein IR152_10680 [Clostridioides sp. ES-S-0108-01]|uniref:hypothetical protein n=1 Tax=Clostridioides sp. ES-S-0108-01 TaxID=2770773 RepID=UPI001D0C6215|nr:hypothetical protein [Clostridioides sp. ES-S-0108-01]